MSLTDQEIIELHELLDDLVENNLAGKRLRRLEEWLVESEAARRRYVRFMDLSASLRHYAEECFAEEDDVVPFENEKVGLLSYFRLFVVAAAAVVLAYVGFQSYEHWREKSEDPNLNAGDTPEIGIVSSGFVKGALAQLTVTSEVEWASDSERRPNPGDSLPPGSLQLETGLAQVEMLSGATIVVEGPADFSLSSPDEIYLAKGKLRATLPPGVADFTVEMPNGKVIDLGTEFGLNVRENGAAEINVFEGRVMYEGKDMDPAVAFRELKGGESISIDEDGTITPIAMPSEPFFGAAEIAFRSMEEAQRRYAAWVSLSEELANDKQVALYFGFDDHRVWDRALRDDTRNKNKTEDGAIVGCKWVEGRWPGKGALRFSGENDRVKLKLRANLSSVTLAVWMRLDSHRNSLTPILHGASNTRGVLAWGITKPGNILLRVNQGSELVDLVSPVVFTPNQVGQWVHLTTTYDSKQGKVAHYFNGLYKGSENLRGKVRFTLNGCDLGNLNSKDKNAPRGQNLHGLIDEFVVFRKALDAERILRLYEIGRPFPVARLDRLP